MKVTQNLFDIAYSYLIACLQVYVTALRGYVPSEITRCISAFLDACYIARRADFSAATLAALDEAVARFHHHREIFRTSGIRANFNLPRQHALKHYRHHIEEFGAPGGLCSSITESRHITAVKRPWRRSNRYAALGQMLRINQRLDKLAAARVHFVKLGMLRPSHAPPPQQQHYEEHHDDDDGGPIDDTFVIGAVELARTKGMFELYHCADQTSHVINYSSQVSQ